VKLNAITLAAATIVIANANPVAARPPDCVQQNIHAAEAALQAADKCVAEIKKVELQLERNLDTRLNRPIVPKSCDGC
jgi:hypothetical protein